MSNVLKKKRTSTAKLVTLITISSVLFVALSFGAYLFIIAKINEASIKRTEQAVTAFRERHDQTGGIARLKTINTLREAGVILADDEHVNYASRFDTCFLAGVSAGWIYTSWDQKCNMRYVDIFETSLSLNDIQSRLRQKNVKVEDPTDEYESYARDSACTPKTLRIGEISATIVYVPAGKFESSEGKNSAGQLCMPPYQTMGATSDTQTIVEGSNYSITQKYYAFKEADIDFSKAYVYTVREDTYYTEKLGCTGFIFCDSPREKPITGFKE